jgi:hypothetical protein
MNLSRSFGDACIFTHNFHFRTPHPHFDKAKVESDACQQAVALLATEGSLRLGLDAIGAIIDVDRDLEVNHLRRMSKNFSVPESSSKPQMGEDRVAKSDNASK